MAKKENSEAAKKIANAEKEKTKKSGKKKANIFVRMGKSIKRFFKDLRGEVKKITWPDAKTVLKGTVVTIVCIAIIGLAVFLIDLGLTKGIGALRGVAEDRTSTTVTVPEKTTVSGDKTPAATKPAAEVKTTVAQ